MADCTILILTYKGKKHLEFLLPTIKDAINNYNGGLKIDVLIVDNGKDEVTKQYATENFPEYNYQFSPENDYLFSLNVFVQQLQSKYVIILNDDMKMHIDMLNNLLPVIKNDDSIFAVTCRVMDWDGTYTASAVRVAKYTRGWMHHWFDSAEETQRKYTLYPGGGAAIFNTKYFNEIGGFDKLYRPAYCEDVDLGIIAWQKGWKVVYDPSSILYHREGGTINDQFKKDKLEQMIMKNHILWSIKNVRYTGFLSWFFLLLPYRLLRNLLSNKNQYKAFISAMPHFSEALKKRSAIKAVQKDEVWLEKLNTVYNPA